jgi:hypothetical protein
MAEGFGQDIKKSTTTARVRELLKRVDGVTDPEDIMLMIMDIFKEEVLYPEPGKFYTFIYNPKTPEIEYDQHPLIACTELYKWGFKAINFHWRKSRQYTWEEVAGKLHVVKYNELDELISLQYGKFRLNK